jgi:PAS domain S-box-containing protein
MSLLKQNNGIRRSESRLSRSAVFRNGIVITLVGFFLFVFTYYADVTRSFAESYAVADHWGLVQGLLFLLFVAMGLLAFSLLRWRESKKEIAERERAEKDVHEASQQLKSIFNNARDVIFTLSKFGKITSLNPAFETLTGLQCTDWLRKSFAVLLHPDDVHLAVNIFRQILKGEKPPLFELRIQSKAGKYLTGEFTATAQYHQGRVEGVLGIARDVTTRKEAENALRRSEMWLGTIFEASRDGIVVEYDEKIVFANRPFAQLYGYSDPNELIGQHVSIVQAPEDNERMLEFGRKRLRGEPTPMSYEFKGKRRDGAVIDLEASVATSTIDDKRYIVTIIRDIAERKRADEVLKIQKAYFEQLFENSPEAIVVIDENDKVTRANSEFTRMFGYSKEEALGESLHDLIVPDELIDEARMLSRTVTSGSVSRETRRQCKDGTLLDVSILATPIRVEDDQAAFYVIYRDITEAKAAEEERIKLIHELQEALANIKTLSGLLPICSSCKNIRDDKGYWHQVEAYVQNYTEANFTHGICPDCAKKLYPEFFEKIAPTN